MVDGPVRVRRRSPAVMAYRKDGLFRGEEREELLKAYARHLSVDFQDNPSLSIEESATVLLKTAKENRREVVSFDPSDYHIAPLVFRHGGRLIGPSRPLDLYATLSAKTPYIFAGRLGDNAFFLGTEPRLNANGYYDAERLCEKLGELHEPGQLPVVEARFLFLHAPQLLGMKLVQEDARNLATMLEQNGLDSLARMAADPAFLHETRVFGKVPERISVRVSGDPVYRTVVHYQPQDGRALAIVHKELKEGRRPVVGREIVPMLKAD